MHPNPPVVGARSLNHGDLNLDPPGNSELKPAQGRTHSDFADGVVDALVAAHFLQSDGVELAFV